MTRKSIVKCIALLSLFLSSACLFAQSQQLINYQGKLILDGSPADSALDITFTIYDAESGGMNMWSEQQTVTVVNGIFNVHLGRQVSFPGDLFKGMGDRFLAVQLANDVELMSRFQLTSVAYAIKSTRADTANVALRAGAGHSLDAVDGTPVDVVFVNENGDVGIGTINPTEKLDIAGRIKVTTVDDIGSVNNSTKILVHDSDGVVKSKAVFDLALQGVKGDKGNTGEQGIQGLKGDTGEQGIQGLQGDTGEQGIQGLKGDTGEQGIQGLQGDTGEQGIQGLKGDTGEQGIQGLKGDTGEQGIQGLKGDTGEQGIQGLKGDTGEQGIQGLKGDIGEQGIQGLKGDTGEQGIQGLKGDTGEQGIQGLKGDTGEQGIQGLKGDTGEQGIQGLKGDTGPQGIQGLKGDKGDIGPQGVQGIKGDKGDIGPQGVQGLKGDKGDRGLQGIPGPIGGSNGQLIYNNNGVAAGTDISVRVDEKNNINLGIGSLEDENASVVLYGALNVVGAFFHRGELILQKSLFEPNYQLESIKEHAEFMRQNKYLKGIPNAKIDENGNEIVEVGAHRKGVVEELEKAHIYIEQLHKRLEAQENQLASLRQQMEEFNAR